MRSLWLDTHPLALSPEDHFTPDAHYESVIVGAGLTGLTTAVLLARSGHTVAVVESRSVGAVATGNTTAKASLLQGTTLSEVRRHQSESVLQAYVDGNREGQAWLARYLDEHGVDYQLRTAYTYATTEQGAESVSQEFHASQLAGLDTYWTDETGLPFPVTEAIALDDQVQFHPMEVLDALASELRGRGGVIFEDTRVTGASSRAPVQLTTTRGALQAENLILATGTPILDRGGYFAKLKGHRSYAMTYRLPNTQDDHAALHRAELPHGMYLSADSPGRTLRTVPYGKEELLLIGGNDHVVGRSHSPQAAIDNLEEWTQQHFPGAMRTHAWAAQDYRSANYIPFFGALPRGGGNIYLATGYNKWGMTNGVAAALAISSELLGGSMDWAKTLGTRITTPSDLLTGLKDGAEVGTQLATGWAQAELHALPEEAPAEGQGVVGRKGGKPVAASTVDGTTCEVSAICPHMGGILTWNDAERSWDCPLHASRFSAEGTLLEGPAVTDLSPAA